MAQIMLLYPRLLWVIGGMERLFVELLTWGQFLRLLPLLPEFGIELIIIETVNVQYPNHPLAGFPRVKIRIRNRPQRLVGRRGE